jgi:hypothetical protein
VKGASRALPPLGWIALALLVAYAAARRQLVGDAHDFLAFHTAAARLIAGENPYVASDAYPYKYAPSVLAVFVPFGLTSLEVARKLYLLLTIVATLAVPALVARILRGERSLARELEGPRLLGATALGLVASLRFLDNEYHSVNANVLALAILLSGYALLVTASRRSGSLAVAFGSLFKFHPFLALGVFLRSWRSVLFLVAAAGLVACIPDPRLWPELLRQLRETGSDFQITGLSHPMQGLYPLGVLAFGWERTSLAPFLLFLPVALAALALVPKFDLFLKGERPVDKPAAFLLSSLSLLLLAATVSPLPWQHTYVIFWAAVPAAWICGSRAERRWILAISLALAISPRGIVGAKLSNTLEYGQIVLWLAWAHAAVLISQARRHARR